MRVTYDAVTWYHGSVFFFCKVAKFRFPPKDTSVPCEQLFAGCLPPQLSQLCRYLHLSLKKHIPFAFLAGLPDASFAEVSELMPPWISSAVPTLPVEDSGSPDCSDVTNCISD